MMSRVLNNKIEQLVQWFCIRFSTHNAMYAILDTYGLSNIYLLWIEHYACIKSYTSCLLIISTIFSMF